MTDTQAEENEFDYQKNRRIQINSLKHSAGVKKREKKIIIIHF
jgi:hypothetical protein